MKAVWNNTVVAESDETVEVEGNQYFPAESINKEYFQPSETHSVCGWKGTASYYDVVVDGSANRMPRGFTRIRSRTRRISKDMLRSGRV